MIKNMSTESKTALVSLAVLFITIGLIVGITSFIVKTITPQGHVPQETAMTSFKNVSGKNATFKTNPDGSFEYSVDGVVRSSPFTKNGVYLLTDHGIEYQGESKPKGLKPIKNNEPCPSTGFYSAYQSAWCECRRLAKKVEDCGTFAEYINK